MKRKLQVFISSTFNDLIDERQAAVAAILKAGHIPAGMELFTAGDKSQMTTIEKWINESDVYMLILGGRYGSVEQITNISYTELEYDFAVQQSKPLFAVVITDEYLENKIRLHGSNFGEKQNPKELDLFRKKVLSNISSFFSDLKDIKLCVHESLSDLSDNPSLVGWVPASELNDMQILQDEIRRLSEENSILKRDSTLKNSKEASAEDSREDDFSSLKNILRGIEIKVPSDAASNKKEFTNDLLSLFTGNYEFLVTGVTNRIGASEAEIFMFSNVAPKLQIHGLVKIDKVVGTQYRIATTTRKGDLFLSEIQKRAHASQSSAPKTGK